MSKGPTPRHSKPPKPITIDLDATDVTPKSEDLKPKPASGGPATSAPVTAKVGDAAEARGGAESAAAASASKSAVPGVKADTGGNDDDAKAATSSSAGPKPQPKTAGTGSGPSRTDANKPEATTRDARPGTSTATDRPSVAAAKGTGAPGILAAGLIGAVIALGAGYGLQMGGLLPSPGSAGDQVQALNSRLDSVSTSVEALSSQVAESANGGEAGISAQLTARLDRLETSLAETGPAGEPSDPAAMQALDERFSALESRIAGLAESGGNTAADPALAEAIREMRAAQSGLQAAFGELQTQTSGQIAEISAKIAEIEQTQADLAQQLEEPGRQVDLARAIASAGLKSAIDRGGSFMSELEAFASVAPDDPAVAELRDLAASGVPSRSSLIEDFPEAASTAIAAADPGDPNAGLVDRLMSSALSVVKVRKVGDVEGDSAEAIAARAEARLMDGDLDAALAEWNSLPEASRAAASGYGDALAARARAEKLIAASLAPAAPGGEPASSEAPAN